MATIHTRHSALMVVRSKERGQAIWLAGHPAIVAKSKDFHNPIFKGYEAGTVLDVDFRLSSSRYLMRAQVFSLVPKLPGGASTAEVVGTISKWIGTQHANLTSQMERFERICSEDECLKSPQYESWKRALAMAVDEAAVTVPVEVEAPPEPKKTPVEAPSPSSEEAAYGGIWLAGVWMPRETAKLFKAALQLIKTSPVNVLMTGPSGYGKSSIPQAFADAYGMKFVRVNCAAIRDPEEWFGFREAQDGSTVFEPSEFAIALMEGNAIILLDELNRMESWLHNTLYPILDHARTSNVHGKQFKVGENVLFAAAINSGHQYTGTFMLDGALVNRFDMHLAVGPLDEVVEADLLVRRYELPMDVAQRIVKIMSRLRELYEREAISVDVSTRTSLKIARLYSSGLLNIRECFKAAVFNALDAEEVKTAVDATSSMF